MSLEFERHTLSSAPDGGQKNVVVAGTAVHRVSGVFEEVWVWIGSKLSGDDRIAEITIGNGDAPMLHKVQQNTGMHLVIPGLSVAPGVQVTIGVTSGDDGDLIYLGYVNRAVNSA